MDAFTRMKTKFLELIKENQLGPVPIQVRVRDLTGRLDGSEQILPLRLLEKPGIGKPILFAYDQPQPISRQLF